MILNTNHYHKATKIQYYVKYHARGIYMSHHFSVSHIVKNQEIEIILKYDILQSC